MSTYYEKNKHKPEFRARKNKENKAWRERNKERFKQMQKEWMEENRTGRKKYNRYRDQADNHPIEKVGARLRSMMGWIKNSSALAQTKKAGASKRKLALAAR